MSYSLCFTAAEAPMRALTNDAPNLASTRFKPHKNPETDKWNFSEPGKETEMLASDEYADMMQEGASHQRMTQGSPIPPLLAGVP